MSSAYPISSVARYLPRDVQAATTVPAVMNLDRISSMKCTPRQDNQLALVDEESLAEATRTDDGCLHDMQVGHYSSVHTYSSESKRTY